MMGLRIEFARIVHEPLLKLALVTLSRVALAFGAFALAGRRFARGWRSVVALSEIRGALSVARSSSGCRPTYRFGLSSSMRSSA